MTKAHKGCPFCRSTIISVRTIRRTVEACYEDGEVETVEETEEGDVVFCVECGARGPAKVSHGAALEAWNKRTKPKPLPKEPSKMRPFGHLPRHELQPLLRVLKAEYETMLVNLPKQAANDPKLTGDRVVELLEKKDKEIWAVKKEIARR